jgi:hypothetical protein
MTTRLFILVAAAALLTAGCTSKQEPSSPPQLMARVHFSGANRVMAEPGATQLKAVAALPETAAFLRFVFDRLSRSPAVLSDAQLSPEAVSAASPVLRSMIEDLWRNEFAATLLGVDRQPTDWTLAVRLPSERMGAWRTNLAGLAATWKLGNVRQGIAGTLPTMEIGASNSPVRLRWVEAGDWGLLGVGTPSLPGLARTLQQVAANQPPAPALTNTWLEAWADLQALAPSLRLAERAPWPTVDLAVRGDGENVRSFGTLDFPEDVTGPLEPWQVPTNVITEPLVSFGAARGIGPLLARSDLLQTLRLQPVPNRCFTWALQALGGQVFMAFPMPGLTNLLAGIAEQAPALLPQSFHASGPPRFTHVATNHSVVWQGVLPYVVPSLKSQQSSGGEYALVSLFPSFPVTPPPQALLDQLSPTNLVFYNWEITEQHLKQWLMITQLGSVLTKTPQLVSTRPTLPWLNAAAPHLGNSATEVLALSPRRWSFNRKSQIGLTGPELVFFARWIENVSFPKGGLLIEDTGESAARRAPVPAQP